MAVLITDCMVRFVQLIHVFFLIPNQLVSLITCKLLLLHAYSLHVAPNYTDIFLAVQFFRDCHRKPNVTGKRP